MTLPTKRSAISGAYACQPSGPTYRIEKWLGLVREQSSRPIVLVTAYLIPMLPLLLTMMPLKDIVRYS
jgi:hypothetical protein